jgi:demethylspheroidene O-methyltransferase
MSAAAGETAGDPVSKSFLRAFFQKSASFRLTWRDRLLASPKFQSWAARFPLTRRVARREARALFDICAGFVYAQTLHACIELNLFEILAPGPLDSETLAARCTIPAAPMLMLLNAATSLRLLELSTNRYRLGPLGAALRGNPGIAAMVAHHRMFYADIANPVALLRGETTPSLSQFWPYRGAGDAAGYSAIMAESQPMIAAEILAAYDFSRHKCVLDVGGGDGSFLRRLARQAPAPKLQLFDLPPVAEQATRNFAIANLAARATAFGGNFAQTPLPTGADIITLIRVLHDHNDDRALALLKAARLALPPGGILLLAEPMAGTKGAEPIGAAYFGFYLLAMGSGKARTPAEIEALLRAAGFSDIRQIPTSQPMLTNILTCVNKS